MYVEVVPNRGSNPTVLLREGWREGKKVHKRTLANLSKLPPQAVEALRRTLRGETLLSAQDELEIERTWPHGAVAAVVGTLKKLKLDQLLASRRSPDRDRVLALVAARVLAPSSRLGVSRMLDPETAANTLGQVLDVEGVRADQLYAAMDWLQPRQKRIEAKLAQRHLVAETLVLYDVTSSYFTGTTCPLAKRGYSRDKKRGTLQIVVGLLCTPEGCPISVEVFPGNTADPATLAAQVFKVRERWGLDRVIWVADRGLLTDARIREELREVEGMDWVSALRSPAIKALVKEEALQLSLFDEQDLFEFTSDQYPEERLVACRNPLLAARRARKREALLVATEQDLEKIAVAVTREKKPLREEGAIGVRAGKVLGKYKVAKHFLLEITEDGFTYRRNEEKIENESRLDGVYVIRTSVKDAGMDTDQVVRQYKELAHVERAFRSMKTMHLEVRPIHHRLAERVKAHVFICMLAYYVLWHMRQALAPLLFQDEFPEEDERDSVVAPAVRSAHALQKVQTKRTEDGFPVSSMNTLLQALATLSKNRMRFGEHTFEKVTTPTPLQKRAFELLQVPSP